jgi:glycosyltransferase involved in cell wall biosynthesis
MALGSEEREAMGARGREHVRDHYAWETVARQMAKAYQRCNTGVVIA